MSNNKKSGSIVWPLVLIGTGLYFLSQQFGWGTPSLNWNLLFRLWPVFLILGGFNILAGQIEGPFGAFFKNIMGIATFVTFGVILLFGDKMPIMERFSGNEAITEQVTVERGNVDDAVMKIDFTSAKATVATLQDSSNLMEGSVSHRGTMSLKNDVSGRTANVDLKTTSQGIHFGSMGALTPWEINLNPNVPLDIDFDLGSGNVTLDLDELQIDERVRLDGGSGGGKVFLPDGEYEIDLDGGSGGWTVDMPDNGRFDMDVNGGSGLVQLNVPDNVAVRFEIDTGSGTVTVPKRYQRIDNNEDNDRRVYETEGYESADNQLTLKVDGGSGAVRVTE